MLTEIMIPAQCNKRPRVHNYSCSNDGTAHGELTDPDGCLLCVALNRPFIINLINMCTSVFIVSLTNKCLSAFYNMSHKCVHIGFL
jgi:hypothetical protein